MALTMQQLQNVSATDEELFQILSEAVSEHFPQELQEDRDKFIVALHSAPRGIRAMAGIYDLDVSLAMDDLAWHFGNHHDERFLAETEWSLRELEADEAAEIFRAAWKIVESHLPKMREWIEENGDFAEYLEDSGIQAQVDPLNDQISAVTRDLGDIGLLQLWVRYARKYPERCVGGSGV